MKKEFEVLEKKRLEIALLEFVEKVSKGQATTEKEIEVFPAVAQVLVEITQNEQEVRMKKGKITSKRVGRAINVINSSLCDDKLKSGTDDYAIIADIIKLISSKEYMSTIRAQNILSDASKIIPYISELKLL